MDIAPLEALNLARRWQKKETPIRGSLFTNSQELQITFAGHVTVENDGIVISSEHGFEISIRLLPEMTIKYGEAVLEIRQPGYRYVLYEPKH